MDLNVDVICNDTGEVLKEGVMLANAHIFIAKRNGKIISDEIEFTTADDIDGSGVAEVRSLWVEIPEIHEEIQGLEEKRKEAQGFWRY